jgi:hypothetical protein
VDTFTPRELKDALRAGRRSHGYAVYFVAADGQPLSFEAVRDNFRLVLAEMRDPEERDQWRVIGVQTTAEDDEPPVCAHTGKIIE